MTEGDVGFWIGGTGGQRGQIAGYRVFHGKTLRSQSDAHVSPRLQTPRHYSIVARFPHSKICVFVSGKSILNFTNLRKSAKRTEVFKVCMRQLHQNAAAGCEPAALD
jgi:hypothetical protein